MPENLLNLMLKSAEKSSKQMEALFHQVVHLSRKKMHKGNILLEKMFCYEPKLEIRFKMCRFSDFSTCLK